MLRLFNSVLLLCLMSVSALAQDAANLAEDKSKEKTPIPTICPVAHFGDPDVPGAPLYVSATSALTQDAQGNIYSTSPDGGKLRRGAAYKVTPDGEMTVLYDFGQPLKNHPKKKPTDPDVYLTGPSGGLVPYGDNTLIGVSGGGELKVGAIFSIPVEGGEPKILWSFRNGIPTRKLNPGEKDYTEQEKLDWAGSYPSSAPVMAGGGFYGVTPYANNQRYGVYYSLSGGYTGKYFFKGENGYKPWNLIAGRDGKLYGITSHGTNKSTAYMGTVFMADPGGGSGGSTGPIAMTPIDGGGGSQPSAMLLAAVGTTGTVGLPGASAAGGGGGVKLLYEGTRAKGYGPAAIIQGSDNQLYVAMAGGGYGAGYGLGSIMKIDPATGQHEVIHYFEGKNKGWRPASLVEGPDGKLYGVVLGGGHCGGFYSMDRDGKNYNLFHLFNHNLIGHRPHGPLLVDVSQKYIYGTTYQVGQHGSGSLYRVDLHKDEPLAPPGIRICCSLWSSPRLGMFGHTPKDVSALKGHKYGSMGASQDPVGYVYTNHLGLIDIAHLRDMADMERYVYEKIMIGERSLTLPEGTVEVNIPKEQYSQELALRVAGAITYAESWAHELRTWPDFSSFSPEDNISNMLGIFVGRAAIEKGCNFNDAMDEELPRMLNAFDPQPAVRTSQVLAAITTTINPDGTPLQREGKWVMGGPPEVLVRRNFYGRVWLVPPETPRYVPRWLNANYFSPHYKYFTYTMKTKIKKADGTLITVTQNDMAAVTEMLRETWLKDEKNKGMADWP